MKRCTHVPTTIACVLSLFGSVAPLIAQDAQVAAPLLGGDDIGFQTINCSAKFDGVDEPAQIKAAWEFLFTDIRGPLMSSFRSCLDSAELVEASCDDLQDHSRIIDALMADRVWAFKCAELGGNTNARAGGGSSMLLDHAFLKQSPERIASVMAHELMHNLGYTHETSPLNTEFYPLTVNEQVEACVLVAAGLRTRPNRVSADHTDARSFCGGSSWCNPNGCFHTGGLECGPLPPHFISGGVGYYCYDFPAAENCVLSTDTYACIIYTFDQNGNAVHAADFTPPPP